MSCAPATQPSCSAPASTRAPTRRPPSPRYVTNEGDQAVVSCADSDLYHTLEGVDAIEAVDTANAVVDALSVYLNCSRAHASGALMRLLASAYNNTIGRPPLDTHTAGAMPLIAPLLPLLRNVSLGQDEVDLRFQAAIRSQWQMFSTGCGVTCASAPDEEMELMTMVWTGSSGRPSASLFVQGRVSSLQCAQRPEVIKGFPLGAYPDEWGVYAPFYSFDFGGSPPALMRMPLEGAFIVVSMDRLRSTVWAHPKLTTMQIVFMAMAQYGTIFALFLNFKRVFIFGHFRRLRGVAAAPATQMQKEDVQATMANPMRAVVRQKSENLDAVVGPTRASHAERGPGWPG